MKSRILFLALVGHGLWLGTARAEFQSEAEVPPDATPEIQEVKPSQAAAGSQVTVVIRGKNFSSGVYISFSDPLVHVVSTRRVSATQLEGDLAIAGKAPPGSVRLYVSNPAGSVAETAFAIVAGSASPPPAAPSSSSQSAAPEAHSESTQPGASAEPAHEARTASANSPEVTAVVPASVGQGTATKVKVTGKNFVRGAKVVFSNPGIRVLEMQFTKSSELTVSIQVASDAATGASSLFVVNPDESEVEASFQVIRGQSSGSQTASQTPGNSKSTAGASKSNSSGSSGKPSSTATQSFEVYNLGDAKSILQSAGKAKGTLVVGGGKLTYAEAGKEVFSSPLGEIKEIGVNALFGINTGTFHVILNSGKTYNFIAGSLRPADTQTLVNSLRDALAK